MGRDSERAQRSRSGSGSSKGGSPSLAGFGGGTGRAGLYGNVPNIGRIVDAIAFAGDAITLGRTSDGGANSITILTSGGTEKAWPHSQEELDEKFRILENAYLPVRQAAPGGAPAPPPLPPE